MLLVLFVIIGFIAGSVFSIVQDIDHQRGLVFSSASFKAVWASDVCVSPQSVAGPGLTLTLTQLSFHPQSETSCVVRRRFVHLRSVIFGLLLYSHCLVFLSCNLTKNFSVKGSIKAVREEQFLSDIFSNTSGIKPLSRNSPREVWHSAKHKKRHGPVIFSC